MTKKTILILALILLSGAATVYYFVYDRTETTNQGNPTQIEINFRKPGILMRNNPGLKPDTWYLNYEQPGQPGLKAELLIDSQSLCETANQEGDTYNTFNCSSGVPFSQGQ